MNKFKNALDKGVASVTVKSSVFLETSKLSTQITNAQHEIQQTKAEMAEQVYAIWRSGEPTEQAVEHYCSSIVGHEERILEFQTQITRLKQEGQQILGEKTLQNQCVCGAINTPGAKFCFQCGAKLL